MNDKGELLCVHEEYLERLEGRIERYRSDVIDLCAALREIHIQAADAQLRASYQRIALEQISAKAQAALAKAERP